MPGLDGLAIDMRSLATRLGSAGARRLTEAAAAGGKKAALVALKADLPSMRLRNMGKKGTKLGVGYDLLTDTTAEIKLRPRGAWVLLDKGAARHDIGSGRRSASGKIVGKAKKGKRRRLHFGGRFSTAPIGHPGFAGRNTITTAVAAMAKAVPVAVADELARVIDGG